MSSLLATRQEVNSRTLSLRLPGGFYEMRHSFSEVFTRFRLSAISHRDPLKTRLFSLELGRMGSRVTILLSRSAIQRMVSF